MKTLKFCGDKVQAKLHKTVNARLQPIIQSNACITIKHVLYSPGNWQCICAHVNLDVCCIYSINLLFTVSGTQEQFWIHVLSDKTNNSMGTARWRLIAITTGTLVMLYLNCSTNHIHLAKRALTKNLQQLKVTRLCLLAESCDVGNFNFRHLSFIVLALWHIYNTTTARYCTVLISAALTPSIVNQAPIST